MSIKPGALKVKDPESVIQADFNWDDLLEVGVQITDQSVTVSGPDQSLQVDAVSVVPGVNGGVNRQVNYRLSGGTLGAQYTVSCEIVTDESAPQTQKRSFRVLIQGL